MFCVSPHCGRSAVVLCCYARGRRDPLLPATCWRIDIRDENSCLKHCIDFQGVVRQALQTALLLPERTPVHALARECILISFDNEYSPCGALHKCTLTLYSSTYLCTVSQAFRATNAASPAGKRALAKLLCIWNEYG